MKKLGIKTLIIGMAFLGMSVATHAADTEVDVDLNQTIDLTNLDITSGDGEVKAALGSLTVGAKSKVDAVIDSKLEVQSIAAETKDGKAIASIGAVSVAE